MLFAKGARPKQLPQLLGQAAADRTSHAAAVASALDPPVVDRREGDKLPANAMEQAGGATEQSSTQIRACCDAVHHLETASVKSQFRERSMLARKSHPFHKGVGKRALNVIFASLARGSLFMRAESKGVSAFTEGIQRLKRPKFGLLPREQLLLHPYRVAFQTVLLIRTIAWTPRFPN
jgi:hypothetical protein